MINGLGLFASLAAPETAQPQPAAPDDPALFAAALVAALGLQQPVQVTVTPAKPVVEGEPVADEDAETAPEEEPEFAPTVARITPDPDVEEEVEVLDRVPVTIDIRIDEPATPVASKTPVAPKEAATGEVTTKEVATKEGATKEVATRKVVTKEEATKEVVTKDAVTREVATKEKVAAKAPVIVELPLQALPSIPLALPVVVAKAAEVPAGVPADIPADAPTQVHERKAAQVASDAPSPPITFVPPTPVVPPVQAPAASAPKAEPEQGDSVDRPAPKVAPVTSQPSAPPQSLQERTARAMAENVRVGRQLAELLGEENVTEFKVELSQRRMPEAKAVLKPLQQQVVQEEEAPVASWTELPVVPTMPPQPKASRQPVQGTLVQEARDAAPARPFTREPSLVTPLTSRPEIVRMVANASLATSPDMAQTEGAPAVAKAPAPSVTPSLPDARQELPAAPEREHSAPLDDSERPRIRESHSSADPSASSAASANNSPAVRSAPAPENGRETREARNLPSHESTDQKAAGSADRVTLKVADDDGRQTRIRVSVTGSQIRAVITPPDGMSARQLEQRMDQLHETLVRQGFTDPKVVIRAAPEVVSDAAALVGASGSSQDVRSAAPAGKDQPAGDQRQGRGQREQDRGDGHRHPQGHSRGRDPRDRRR